MTGLSCSRSLTLRGTLLGQNDNVPKERCAEGLDDEALDVGLYQNVVRRVEERDDPGVRYEQLLGLRVEGHARLEVRLHPGALE